MFETARLNNPQLVRGRRHFLPFVPLSGHAVRMSAPTNQSYVS
jgi:hypothetical protein